MTPERAIEILKGLEFIKVLENNAHSNIAYHSEFDCKKDNEDFAAIQMAISALEKQIPKKPLPDDKYYAVGQCPSCNAVFLDKNTKCCGNCGQALDWRDEK